mmetsp:Transcript_19873/g.43112  ORF Transcript_19873/g.43112 Transcript_19873/m.43112 type:complete len:207 (+) Transcript_19873:13-633(+)
MNIWNQLFQALILCFEGPKLIQLRSNVKSILHISSLLCLHGIIILLFLLVIIIVPPIISSLQLQPIQIRLQLRPLDQRELFILPHNSNTAILRRQLGIPTHTPHQRPQSVHNQLILLTSRETLMVFFEVRPSRLGSCANGRGVAFVDVPRGTRLIDVRTILIEGCQQQSHPVGTSDVRLCGPLMPIGQIRGQPSGGHGGAVDVFVV